MARYRYLLADVATGVLLADAPLTGVTFSHALNQPGAFSGTLPLGSNLDASMVTEGQRCVYVDRDGVILGGYIIWTTNRTPTQVDITGADFTSYYAHRFFTDSVTYTNIDQLAMVQNGLGYLAGKQGGDIGIHIGAESSPIRRSTAINWYDATEALTWVQSFSAMEGGFDFDVQCSWSGDTVRRDLRLYYPRQGSRTAYVFEQGTNLITPTQQNDGTQIANQVIAVGSGTGSTSIRSAAQNAAMLSAGYPLLQSVLSVKDITGQSTLDGRVREQLRLVANPPLTSALTVVDHPAAPLGAWGVGDDVYVRAQVGYVDIDGWFRVMSYVVTPGDTGPETVSVQVVDAGLYSYGGIDSSQVNSLGGFSG